MIDESAEVAADAELGPYCVVGAGASIGAGTRLGAHVSVHSGTRIGAGCEVQDGAVLGKAPKRARGGDAPPPLVVGDGCVVCCGAIVFAGATLAERVIVGDQAYVRERATIGPGSVVGRGSTIDNDVAVGARVKIQTDVYVTAFSIVEDDVFLGPGASTTNDDTMGRHDASYALRGATLRRASRIGGRAVICPGVEIGEEAFVAAGAVVTRDLPPRAVAMGVPARVVREVGDEDLLENWR
jgi:acetyltransferase-like isoleucine patch superfamily enzyme